MVPRAPTATTVVVEMDRNMEILTNEVNTNKTDVHAHNAVLIIDGDDNEEQKQKKPECVIKTSQQANLSMEYQRKKRRKFIDFHQDEAENIKPKRPDKQETIKLKTPQSKVLPAPGYAVLTDQHRTDGYAVTPDRYNALLQRSEDSQTPDQHRTDGYAVTPNSYNDLLQRSEVSKTPPVPRVRKYVDSADILSGVRPIAPASRVCDTVPEFRPLKFNNINLARQVLDVILGEKTREKYKE